jgi:hypothetical protein
MTRDHKRTPAAKARTLTRRQARVLKSAALFMAIAFPADAAAIAFAPLAR